MDLQCRECGGTMARFERGPVWAYRCDACDTHALTSPSLRRVLPEAVWTEIWPVLRRASARGSRACPSCRGPMDVTPPLEQAGGARLDICDSCHLIWFDSAEFTSLPLKDVPPEAEVPPALARMIALAEVELIKLDSDAREARVFAIVDRLLEYLVQVLLALGRGGR